MSRRNRLCFFVLTLVLAFTAVLAVACANVELPKNTVKTCEVVYRYNYDGAPDGGVYRTEKVKSGDKLVKPAAPTRTDGYTFTEWTKDAAGSDKFNFDTTLVFGKTDLYAQWKKSSSEDPTLASIEVTPPTKVVYVKGEELDLTGMTVKAIYSDTSEQTVATADCEVTGYDKNTVGEQTITVAYKGETDTFTVTVNAEQPTLTDIEITEPTVKTYVEGEKLDTTGLTVKAVYSDGSKVDVPLVECSITGFNSVQTGVQTVTVTYEGKFKTFTVTVNADVRLIGIEVTQKPKTEYEVGDEFDPEGMVVTAKYSDNSSKPVTEYSYSGFDGSQEGTCTIMVSYKGFKDEFDVTVIQITYTVKFVTNVDGIAAPQTQTVNKNAHAKEPALAARNGYTFIGWFDGNASDRYVFATTPVTKDITLTAKWETIEYTVTYVLDVEESIATAPQNGTYTVESNTVVLPKPTIKAESYKFLGWFLTRTGEEGEYTYSDQTTTIAKGSTGNKIFYARIEEKNVYNITFNYNYGTPAITVEKPVVEGENPTPMNPAPTRTGYDFGGWYADAECNTLYGFDTPVTANGTIVYAKWTAKTINVVFNADNGTEPATVSVAFDQAVAAPDPAPTKLGHKFLGWFRLDGTTEWTFTDRLCDALDQESLTLRAHWEVKQYDVVFKNGDKVVKTVKVTFGEVITDKPEDPTKTGYRFDGWYDGNSKWTFASDKLDTEGLTLTAEWTAKSYNVTFDCNGGTPAVTTKVVEFGQKVPAPTTAPTKTGYTLDGWYTAQNVKWSFDSDVLQTEGLALTAKWNANDVTVTFKDEDGTIYGTTTVEYDGKVERPDDPTKTGYTFIHWHKLDKQTIWDFDNSIVRQASLTLEAHWQAQKYKVSYVMGDKADAIAQGEYTYGEAYSLPAEKDVNVKVAGYTFIGWYDNSDFTGDRYMSIPAGATGDKTFYANITQNQTVDFVYNYNYDGKTKTAKVVIGTTAANEIPTRAGYTFGGWYNTQACADGDRYNFDNAVTVRTEIFAQWTPITYTVTFLDGETKLSEKQFTSEENVTAIEKPTKTGYEFKHWFIDDENTAYAFGNKPTSDIVLRAKWELKEYTVTFNYNYGDRTGSKSVKYTQLVEKPTDPTRDSEGYDFKGWFEDAAFTDPWDFAADTMPARNITLYAKWELKEYEVTFDLKGGVGAVASQTVKHGGKVEQPDVDGLSKEGHHLDGWKMKNGTPWNFATDVVTRQLVLEANWVINTYTVTFDSNGGTAVQKQTIEHGKYVAKPTAPTKSGFTFAIWTLDGSEFNFADYAVTKDITLVATWNGDVGTFLYYSNNGTDNWTYGYKAEKNGNKNELVIRHVTIYSGMEFLVATKKQVGDSIWLKAGSLVPGDLGNVMTVENKNSGGNFRLTITDANFEGSVWTIYLYDLGDGVTVNAEGELNKNCFAKGISMQQEFTDDLRKADGTAMTATEAETATQVAYIRGNFTNGFGLYNEWSVAKNNGNMLVKQDGDTYTFRKIYLKKGDGFKIYLKGFVTGSGEAAVDKGWFGGKFDGLGKDIALTDDGSNIYLGSIDDGFYDIIFTNGAAKKVQIINYAPPTAASVAVTAPTKVTYYVGEPFSDAGIKVEYTDTDGDTFTLNKGEYTLSDTATNVVGKKTITVTYKTKTATFDITVNALTVEFDSNGGSAVATQNLSYGEKASKPDDPTLKGYDFGGWYANADCTGAQYDFTAAVTAPVKLTAKWTVHKYDVTFKNGGDVIKTVKVPYNTAVPADEIPTVAQEGYTFNGWKKGGSSYNLSAPVTEDIELTADLTIISYTVTLVYNDGVHNDETQTVNHGETVTQPNANKTDRNGYIFDGWFKNGETEPYSFATQVKGSFTLTAKWTIIEYTVTYVTSATVEGVVVDGTLSGQKTKYTVEESFTPVNPTATVAGYTFLEWRLNSADGEKIEAVVKGTTGNITLYAVYTKNATVSFTFVYNYDGAPANVVRQVVKGTTTAALDASRTGYTFDGWFAQDAVAEFDFTKAIEATTTVYAHWTVNSHNVTFNANGGTLDASTTSPVNADYGSKITKPADPTRSGYDFVYWVYGGKEWKFDEATMPDADVTLYAQWEIKKYTVKFTDGATELSDLTKTNVAHGGTITAPTANLPTKDGYTLSGWKVSGAAADWDFATDTVTDNITLVAQWSIVTYTVEYYVDGVKNTATGNVASYKITDGTVTLQNPQKTGHTFDGWYDNSGYTGDKLTALTFDLFQGANAADPVKIYARFTVNTYTVTFDPGEGTMSAADKTQKVQYNNTATKPADPTRSGYEFVEWRKGGVAYNFAAAVTSDITLVAEWKSAVKVNGLYNDNGDTLVKEFVVQTEGSEYAAKFVKFTATESAPVTLRVYIDNAAVTANTNIKSGSAAGFTSANGVITVKATGVYTLYYKYAGTDLGIYVALDGSIEDWVDPNIVEGDGVYVGNASVIPFKFNDNNMNQVMAKDVEITAADDNTSVEVTFKYGGAAVSLTYIDLDTGITNAGTGNTVKLYSGKYNFYYNYAKNGTVTTTDHEHAAGRLWIEGTQTGDPVVKSGLYVNDVFVAALLDNGYDKLKAVGVTLKANDIVTFYTPYGNTQITKYITVRSGCSGVGHISADGNTLKVKDAGTYNFYYDGNDSSGEKGFWIEYTAGGGTTTELAPSEDSLVIKCSDGSIKFTVVKTSGYVYGLTGINDYSKVFLHIWNGSTNVTGTFGNGKLNNTYTTTLKMNQITNVIVAGALSGNQSGTITIDTAQLHDGVEVKLDGNGIKSYT